MAFRRRNKDNVRFCPLKWGRNERDNFKINETFIRPNRGIIRPLHSSLQYSQRFGSFDELQTHEGEHRRDRKEQRKDGQFNSRLRNKENVRFCPFQRGRNERDNFKINETFISPNRGIIEALYSGLQCSQCSQRFGSFDALQIHQGEHRRDRKEQKKDGQFSRGWFPKNFEEKWSSGSMSNNCADVNFNLFEIKNYDLSFLTPIIKELDFKQGNRNKVRFCPIERRRNEGRKYGTNERFFRHIRNRNPEIIRALYSGLKCSQCSQIVDSLDELRDHLDEHFRVRMKQKSAGRISRGWYPKDQQWMESHKKCIAKSCNSDKNSNFNKVNSEATPLRKCHYCWEQFEVEYFDDVKNEEGWFMMHCVLENNILFHPTCQ